MSSAILSRHCAQRIAARTGFSEAELLALWGRAREATIYDLATFCTWKRPNTICRVIDVQGTSVLIVKSLTTGRFVTILRKH